MKKAFIYTPPRLAYASHSISKYALQQKVCPINPYLNFGDLMNTLSEETRLAEISLLEICDELWAFKINSRDTKARRFEDFARKNEIRVRQFKISGDAKDIWELK